MMLLRPMAPPRRGGATWWQDNGNCSFFSLARPGLAQLSSSLRLVLDSDSEEGLRTSIMISSTWIISIFSPNLKSSSRSHAVWLHDVHGSPSAVPAFVFPSLHSGCHGQLRSPFGLRLGPGSQAMLTSASHQCVYNVACIQNAHRHCSHEHIQEFVHHFDANNLKGPGAGDLSESDWARTLPGTVNVTVASLSEFWTLNLMQPEV